MIVSVSQKSVWGWPMTLHLLSQDGLCGSHWIRVAAGLGFYSSIMHLERYFTTASGRIAQQDQPYDWLFFHRGDGASVEFLANGSLLQLPQQGRDQQVAAQQ